MFVSRTSSESKFKPKFGKSASRSRVAWPGLSHWPSPLIARYAKDVDSKTQQGHAADDEQQGDADLAKQQRPPSLRGSLLEAE